MQKYEECSSKWFSDEAEVCMYDVTLDLAHNNGKGIQ